MTSAAQRRLNRMSRWLEKPSFALTPSQWLLRKNVDLYARFFFPKEPGAAFEQDRLAVRTGDAEQFVPALWCGPNAPPEAPSDDRRVLLYFHGGGYTIGGPDTHKHLLARYARIAGVDGLLVDYRLAPEHPFPAAFDDAVIAYRALLERGWRGDQIALAGDSAGGGIALALLSHLLTAGAEKPACLMALSPLTDLTGGGASWTANEATELMLPKSWLARAVKATLAGADPKDPRISPLFAEFPDPPPCLFQAASGEILVDDSRRMVAKLRDAGGEAALEETPDVMHVWQLHMGQSPEADAAIDSGAAFLARRLKG